MSEPAGNLPLAPPKGAAYQPIPEPGPEIPEPPLRAAPFTASPLLPLVVDLDGTLIASDLLIESIVRLLRDQPLAFLALPGWLLRGRAHLKGEVARRVELDPTLLPYRAGLLEYVRAEHDRGRKVILATASDERLAQPVAAHLGCFDKVLASDGKSNLSGERKRARLVEQLGERGFDYIGNESRDLPVWSSARKAIVVSTNPRLLRAVARVTDAESAFTDRRASLREYVSALRPEHWLKNLLVFVTLFAAHLFFSPVAVARTLIGFAAFCCCASGGYLVNDLLDLEADRRHPQKRLRPFASGRLPLGYAVVIAPALLILGGLMGAMLSPRVLGLLLLYVALTLTYSLSLKRVALLDILVLATLYTLRIVAGAAALVVWPSVWLIGFSMFLFTSLAFVKRYAELVIMCPLLLYWLGYLWLIAHRGQMYHAPLVFALRNRTSRILILLMVAIVLLAI